MKKSSTKIILSVVIIALIAVMLSETFNQSGVKDLKGGFKEVAQYRNDNNTGPIQRIYVVTVTDFATAELEKYGDLMPHTKYGNTKVYFFLAPKPFPTKLEPGDLNFDPKYNEYCMALYEKSAMGNAGLIKSPLR